jgi:hypothetical protein
LAVDGARADDGGFYVRRRAQDNGVDVTVQVAFNRPRGDLVDGADVVVGLSVGDSGAEQLGLFDIWKNGRAGGVDYEGVFGRGGERGGDSGGRGDVIAVGEVCFAGLAGCWKVRM